VADWTPSISKIITPPPLIFFPLFFLSLGRVAGEEREGGSAGGRGGRPNPNLR